MVRMAFRLGEPVDWFAHFWFVGYTKATRETLATTTKAPRVPEAGWRNRQTHRT